MHGHCLSHGPCSKELEECEFEDLVCVRLFQALDLNTILLTQVWIIHEVTCTAGS